jgi:uncharacterized protein YndB with AHSA1/START domain
MKPQGHTLVSHVGAPIDKVFAVLSDPARIPEWLPACRAASSSGPLRKGAKIKVRFGEVRETEFEVIDFSAPNTFGWAERGGRKGHKTFFRLDFAGGSTAVTIKDVWTPPTFAAWLRAKFSAKRNVAKVLDGTVQNLRAAVAR